MSTSDNEEIQLIKDLWKRYGSTILICALIFAVTNFGWRYWQGNKQHKMELASTNYTQMLVAFEQQKNDEAKLYAKRLMQDCPKSSYASLAALMLAKLAVQSNDLKLAGEQLQFIIKKSSNNTLRQITKIRLARVFLELKRPQDALNLLITTDDDAYKDEINEISGDALMALGKTSEAKLSYQKVKETKSPLIKLKMQQF